MLTTQEKEQAKLVDSHTFDLDTVCQRCGGRWGAHNGTLCRDEQGLFVKAEPSLRIEQGDLIVLLEIARVCLRDGLRGSQERELDLSDEELERLHGVVEAVL